MLQSSIAWVRWGVWFSAVVGSFATLSVAQNITANGDFETPPFDSPSITSWIVGGTGRVNATTEGATNGTHSATFNPGGDFAGTTLSQNLSTTAGQYYLLEFDAGITGTRSGSPLQLNVQVSGGSTLLGLSVTPPETHSPVSFRHYKYTFTANSSTTTLQFSDGGLGNGAADTLLDAVSVQPAPTPAASSLPLTNGNFDTGPFDSNGTISGWTIGGPGDLAASTEGATTGNHSAVFNIGQDSQSNTLSQTFATTAGQLYNLDFDGGVFGQHTGGPLQIRARVLDTATGASALDQSVLPPEVGTVNPNAVTFSHFHFVFNAPGTSTTLTFSDVGTGAGGADVVLDTVSVAEATPTPPPTPTPTPTPIPTATPSATPTTLPLNNPSFETGPYMTIGTVAGWTVNGSIASIEEGATDGIHSAAFDAGGDSAGNTLSQSFVTSPNQVYRLDFDAGVFGTTDSNMPLSVQVSNTNPAFSQTVFPPEAAQTHDPSQVHWGHFSFNFTASGSVSTLQFADVFLGNQFADLVLDNVSLIALPSYSQWVATHFTPAQQGNQNVSGWSADPDGDRIANGLEYFSDTDPLAGITAADSNALPRVSVQSSGGMRYVYFSFRRLINWSGNPAVVCVSENLSNWDTTGAQIETVGGAVPVGDGKTETVTVRLKMSFEQGLQRKQLRLQLAQ